MIEHDTTVTSKSPWKCAPDQNFRVDICGIGQYNKLNITLAPKSAKVIDRKFGGK
ncbi:hypothetical protein KL86CLO1_10615 [uncultured Eubacteriales bacterium]|uniref:Uncharacterized protein n=1 Tax=uncultured Eubacteriales bacterium TaxID=172733 RepID=A0A212J6X5_9FIRM|nr:hypothetical protein KL86CLO1_10615 [uncultured Eubacteriales bacterium]